MGMALLSLEIRVTRNDNGTNAKLCSTDAQSGQNARALAADTTRRDAIAASLCARIGDERHDIDDLLVVDRVLTLLLETERPLATLLDRFRRDRFDENDGDDRDRFGRRTHNAAMDHALSIVLLELATKPPVARSPRADEHRRQLTNALRELVDADAIDLRVKNLLVDSGAK